MQKISKNRQNKVVCNKYNSELCKGCHHGIAHKEIITESDALNKGYCKDEYCTTGKNVKCIPV